jgi:LysR family nitrogen assimilation transcriptional regulator
MDLTSLRYFAEVVRQRSMSKAAVRLGVVQPALTRRVQLLEDELGTALLLRHRRGVEPTETGLLVFERAAALLRMAHEIETEVRSQIAEPIGQVRFGFPPSFGILFVGKLLSDYLPRYPRVTFYLLEDFSAAIRESLLAGRIDVGVMSCEVAHPDLDCQPLFEEQLWLVGRAADWAFKPVKQLRPEALKDLPLLLASFLHGALNRLGEERNIRFNVRVEADSLTALREALRAGAGFLITPRSSLDREFVAGEFVGAPVMGLKVSRGLFRRRDRPASRAVLALSDLINQEVERLFATHPAMFRPVSSS